MKIKEVEIAEVTPYVNNPRRNDEAIEYVAASLKEFGWQQPIVVDSEMVIIVGHTRYQAAKRLGMKTIPITIAHNLTNSQAKAYRIADNRIGEWSGWDYEKLAIELGDITIPAEILGFDEHEIEALVSTIEASCDFDEEDYETPEEKNKNIICPNCGHIADKQEFVAEK